MSTRGKAKGKKRDLLKLSPVKLKVASRREGITSMFLPGRTSRSEFYFLSRIIAVPYFSVSIKSQYEDVVRSVLPSFHVYMSVNGFVRYIVIFQRENCEIECFSFNYLLLIE